MLEDNKKNAVAFYDLMFNQNKPEEAIEKYAGKVYIQHNPHVKDGKQGFNLNIGATLKNSKKYATGKAWQRKVVQGLNG